MNSISTPTGMPNSRIWRIIILAILILSSAISWWLFTGARTQGTRMFWSGGAAISAYEALKMSLWWIADGIRARARARKTPA